MHIIRKPVSIKGDYQKAISCYEKAIKINPNYLSAYFNLGNIYIAGASICGSEFEQKAE